MPSNRPSLAYNVEDLTGAALPSGYRPSPATPPAGIVLHDPNVAWLDPGMLMEPGTGFGSAQKADMLGQAMEEAQKFLEPGGGGGGRQAGPDLMGTAQEAVDVLQELSQPNENTYEGYRAGLGLSPADLAGGAGYEGLWALDQSGNVIPVRDPGMADPFLSRSHLPPEMQGGIYADPAVDVAPGGGTVGGGGLNYGAALLPAAGAGLSAYNAYQGLTSGDTSGQIAGAGQAINSLQQALQAYSALTGSGAGAATGAATGAAGGAGSAAGAATSFTAPVLGVMMGQPSARLRSQYYNEGERNTMAALDAVGAVLAPFTFGFSQALGPLVSGVSDIGRKGKEKFQRLRHSSELMQGLMRGLEGLTPETWDAVMSRPIYMAHPEFGVDYGTNTIRLQQPFESTPEYQAYLNDTSGEAALPGLDPSKLPWETVSLDDPRGRSAAMPLADQTVGSFLSTLASDPAVGFGDFAGGAYTANPLINLEGAGKGGYGRIGSVAELVSKVAEQGDDLAASGQSRTQPILDLLGALTALYGSRGQGPATGLSPADAAARGITTPAAVDPLAELAGRGVSRGGSRDEDLLLALAMLEA